MDLILTPVLTILGKYAPDQGVALGRMVGPTALDAAKELASLTLDRLRQQPKTAVIVEEFEQDPAAAQPLLAKKLAEMLQAEPALAARLQELLARYEAAAQAHAAATGTSYQAMLHGSGAIAQGTGIQAVGERGVAIGGSVGGSVVTGDKNIISSDVVGRDKIAGLSGADLATLFQGIYRQVEARPIDPNVDKEEVTQTVQQIEQEVKKGAEANPTKVERWLTNLRNMAPDIGEVTIACLVDPAAGVAMVIKKIAEKVKAEAGQSS